MSSALSGSEDCRVEVDREEGGEEAKGKMGEDWIELESRPFGFVWCVSGNFGGCEAGEEGEEGASIACNIVFASNFNFVFVCGVNCCGFVLTFAVV
jgi:hypothetical protein